MPKIVSGANFPDSLRSILADWGWEVVDEGGAAHLALVEDGIEIRMIVSGVCGDKIFFPIDGKQLEFEWRVEAAEGRGQRLAKRLHDLRSPLNAIQGYAEIIGESAEGDTLRYASNIRTASELLTKLMTPA